MSSENPRTPYDLIDRREAVKRVTALLGGIALVGGGGLLTGCRDDDAAPDSAAADTAAAPLFSEEEIAFLDEVADTILPETSTPGAKAAKVGAFMAVAVTDSYRAPEQQAFRDGLRLLDERSRAMHAVGFLQATPAQRLALLEVLDREQYDDTRRRGEERARRAAAADSAARADSIARRDSTRASARTGAARGGGDTTRGGLQGQGPARPVDSTDAAAGDAHLPDQRQENDPAADAGTATAAIVADPPPHYFRMMKELAMVGYFTSEIGYTRAMRYRETPGRFDPCVPHAPGETLWASHA